jgi:hypothetical protein
MSDESYKVILQGTIREGYDRREVVAALSRAFKQDELFAERLLSGMPRVVKKGLDLATAHKYQQSLQKMGIVSLIETEAPPEQVAPTEVPVSVPAEAPPLPQSSISCPRCGYEPKTDDDVLLVRGDCPKCGLMVNKPESAEQPDESFIRRAAAVDRATPDDYADVEFAPLVTRALASVNTFGLFSLVYTCMVVVFMVLFFPLRDVPYHIAKNFLLTAYNNFPMLLAATSILFVEFLLPLATEGKTWGQREFGIGILFTGEAETGGLLLSLVFRSAAIILITFSPGLLAIKVGGMLGYTEALEPYLKLMMVLMAVPAWVASWLFLLLSPNKRGVLDIATGTIQTEEKILPANALVKAFKPLGVALGFVLVFGLFTPLFFK